jgi:hypothetical protein
MVSVVGWWEIRPLRLVVEQVQDLPVEFDLFVLDEIGQQRNQGHAPHQ